MSEDNPFLGTGWGFPPTFQKETQSVEMIAGPEDIQSSLEILLSTSLGERVMQPTYGSNLKDYIFEPLDSSLDAFLKDLIKTAILYFEPRILLDKVSLESVPLEGMVTISLDYRIRSTNSRYNFVLPFYLNEGASAIP
ncbi:GPW/gp25 family protein [Aliikangiella coralliicola]|uniref:GPW/gp25 family protein n=1 Tax=Aliikangiella coralliicola TaxID=2592383 RepID=A0A545UD89_9GAMM|nr:GPW/gp25 family protein [Aliikangiella coralliicola]TQV87432.1 GPW/gp25 family protein [Aliikangiella coralliicola]